MNIHTYIQQLFDWSLTSGLRIGIIIILTFIATKVGKLLANRLVVIFNRQKDDPEFQKRTKTLGSIIQHVLTTGILIIAAMMVLKELGIEIGPILAAAGIVGLAVGFGAQSLVKDIISGFFILLEDQIREGDVVQIVEQSGLVEKVNLKTTRLRDQAGNVHFIPNGKIDVVTNMTKDYSRYVFNIGVSYREDVDQVIDLIREVDTSLRSDPVFKDDILEPIEILGLDQFGDSALIVKARTKTLPRKQWGVAREFNGRLKKKFDEHDVEIPFPHLTLYMGQDKKGQSPPLHLSIEDNDGISKDIKRGNVSNP